MPSNASTVLRLLKQNDEFKELMVEHILQCCIAKAKS